MSARTPFVPQARQDARTAQTKDQSQQSHNKPTTDTVTVFSPDLSNPLHVSSNLQQPPPKSHSMVQDSNETVQSNGAKPPGGLNSINGADRPLNTSGLMKKKLKNRQSHESQTLSRGPFFSENLTTRPGTADPYAIAQRQQIQQQNYHQSNDQPTSVIAPVPRHALRPSTPTLNITQASGTFSSSSFSTALLQPTLLEKMALDAHTPTSALGFSFSKPKAPTEQHPAQLPSPPTSVKISNTRTFESRPVTDLGKEIPSFTLNMSLPDQTGPQRVLLNADGTRNNLNSVDEQSPTGKSNRRSNQNQLKRSRLSAEENHSDLDASGSHSNYPKRYKIFSGEYNAGPALPAHPTSSPDTLQEQYHQSGSRSPETTVTSPETHSQRRAPLSSHEHHQQPYHQDDQDTAMNDGSRTLDKLLGLDTDAYIEEHMEKYERALERWRDCPMDEWVAGASELAVRYEKILDFVKDHMTAKIKLFATFDARVDDHSAVLSGREKMLNEVKERLVSESGNVLGRSRAN